MPRATLILFVMTFFLLGCSTKYQADTYGGASSYKTNSNQRSIFQLKKQVKLGDFQSLKEYFDADSSRLDILRGEGRFLFPLSCASDSPELIKYLIENGARVVPHCFSLLLSSEVISDDQKLENMKAIFESGRKIDINKVDPSTGKSPISTAADNSKLVEYLLEKGASPSKRIDSLTNEIDALEQKLLLLKKYM